MMILTAPPNMNLSLSSNTFPPSQVPEMLSSDLISTPAIPWSREQGADHDQTTFGNPASMMDQTQPGRKRGATSPAPLMQPFALNSPSLARHYSTAAAPAALTTSVPSLVNGVPKPHHVHQIPQPSSARGPSVRGDMDSEHVIVLSSVEQCMPRAYIRVCLIYKLDESQRQQAVSRLNDFIHKTVEAKPYLAGYVVPKDGTTRSDPVEIRFTTDDYTSYPPIEAKELLNDDGSQLDYDELDRQGFPPSRLRPERVASLPATIADELKAPIFKVQANYVRGGLVVSIYLHHCISDGAGLGLLTSGQVQADHLSFERHQAGQEEVVRALGTRLDDFAAKQSKIRTSLSNGSACPSSRRNLLFKRLGGEDPPPPKNSPGRGCVISFPISLIENLRSSLQMHLSGVVLSKHDTLQALIWRHMVRARYPVVQQNAHVRTSKLLIPVDVRSKLTTPLPDDYFGAAVDFAAAQLDLESLMQDDIAGLAKAARTIKDAVARVDDAYVRQSIALANNSDPSVDVRDLLASNIDRVTGADLYITSWERLGLYEADLGMGLGSPAWVRKPWSRDPGSCIILPRNKAKAQFEVVIQMTESDMTRLVDDRFFMSYVSRLID